MPRKKTTTKKPQKGPKKVCFVIMGFGAKTDYQTGRIIDLDKTYYNLILPVFKPLNFECFRAKDIPHSGVIDVPMYEWIQKADIVVADISTLNPNALYELGVRHALRPFSTIVISESKAGYPFDINHTLIDSYEHLGTDIGVTEANRFKRILKEKVKSVLKQNKTDSPVYTYLPNLNPPSFNAKEIKKIKKSQENKPSISVLINDGENLKNSGDYKTAKLLFEAALTYDPSNSLIIQRIALVTYKSELPNKKKSLLEAEKILKPLNPSATTDTETLGLSGAINKRLYDTTSDLKYLKKSINFYEKGFYINDDYYNGVNLAYMYLLFASKKTKKNEIIAAKERSKTIFQKVIEACNKLIKHKAFNERGDQVWIYQSIAQSHLALNEKDLFKKYLRLAQKVSKGSFDEATFQQHNQKISALLKTLK